MTSVRATVLAIEAERAIASAGLEIDHADPFDRLLIATASVEQLRGITADTRLIDLAARNHSLPISEA